MWDCSKFSRATGPFFLDPALTSRHSDLLGVKRSVWASMSERPQALSGIVIPLATHSFPSELMTTKSGLCKPIKVDKKHRLCVSNPLIAHKRENHIECICLVGHLECFSLKIWFIWFKAKHSNFFINVSRMQLCPAWMCLQATANLIPTKSVKLRDRSSGEPLAGVASHKLTSRLIVNQD